MSDTIDNDALFKKLLRTFFYEFLELFLPDVAVYVERDNITFLDKEIFTDVKGKDKHIADLLAQARFRGHETSKLTSNGVNGKLEIGGNRSWTR